MEKIFILGECKCCQKMANTYVASFWSGHSEWVHLCGGSCTKRDNVRETSWMLTKQIISVLIKQIALELKYGIMLYRYTLCNSSVSPVLLPILVYGLQVCSLLLSFPVCSKSYRLYICSVTECERSVQIGFAGSFMSTNLITQVFILLQLI